MKKNKKKRYEIDKIVKNKRYKIDTRKKNSYMTSTSFIIWQKKEEYEMINKNLIRTLVHIELDT